MSLHRFFTILALLCGILTAGWLLSLPALAAGLATDSAPAENGPHGFAFQAGCPVTVTVTSAGDDGAGTLRRAIADVCDGGTIDFAPGLAGQTIALTSANLTISRTVTVTNPHAPGLAVSGNAARQVFHIQSSGVATLSQLSIVSGTITGSSGCPGDCGGGVLNQGRLTVLNSILSGNSADYGGGIRNDGTLTVLSSTLSGNSAGFGGGIDNIYGLLTVQNSILSGNLAITWAGGGIENYGGIITVQNSTLLGNLADGNGGGIENSCTASGGLLTVENSTLSGNSAGGNGGGIDNFCRLTVQNSTLSNNSTDDGSGGGIANIHGTLNLTATIIANSPAGGDCFTDGGTVAADHSLVEATGSYACGLVDGGAAGNIVGADPLLSLLGNYGGQTPTHALLPGSRALDAGLNCLAADQRGVSRPQPGGGACDIGAFESRGFVLTYGGGSGQSAVINTAFAAPLTLTVSSASGEPVDGGVVTFAGPPSGAGVDPVTTTATIAGGLASVDIAANGTAGGPYTVAAAAAGAPASVGYDLTNLLPIPDMAVLGNGAVIANGGTTPAAADDTDFGSAPASGGQVTHTFTISNGGTGDLNLTGTPAVALSGPAADDFMVVSSPDLLVTAGSTTTFQVRFDPTALGARAASVIIANDDPDAAPYTFAIQGEGAPAVGGTVYLPLIQRGAY